MRHDFESTRRSWNTATRAHNAHKGDQAAFLRSGGDVLFPEELELLRDVNGKRLLHLQCNAGQDSLCLARRGAVVTGVDLSDEAIAFASELSAASGIAAHFEQGEVVEWLNSTKMRFEVVFASYGVVTWMPDLDAWAQGIVRVLEPGGKFVYVEFHPITYAVGADGTLTGDDYFHPGPYVEPVPDYVGNAGTALGAIRKDGAEVNSDPATSWLWGLAHVLDSLAGAGFCLERIREYPYSNGARSHPSLVQDGRRWVWPPGRARVPLMYGLCARRALP